MWKRWTLLFCLTLLLVQLVVQIRLSSLDSQTTDEAVHIAAGYTYVTRGDFRFNPEHPPLVKTLAALPLLALDVKVSPEAERVWQLAADSFFYDSWQENRLFGEELLYGSGNNADQILFWARLPIVILTFLLGLTIFLIARRHWGDQAAVVATALYATNPTVNGHGHLVTTDIALALTFLLATYAFWRFISQPNRARAVWFGVAFALALLTKHTAVILLPVFGLLALLAWRDKSRTGHCLATFGLTLGALAVTVVIIWAGFFFRDPPAPATTAVSDEVYRQNLALTQDRYPEASWASNPAFQLELEELKAIRERTKKFDPIYPRVQPIFSFLPGNYLKGVYLVLGHAAGGHDSFLLGETSKTGWWYYFPFLFLVKTPLVALLLIGGGLYLFVRRARHDKLAQALSIGGGIFLLSAVTSKANLGLRHVLPLFPFFFLITGMAATYSQRFLKIAWAGIAWLVLVAILTFPFYLPYFNEISGGKNNGYRIAGDSNIDWGQDLHRIRQYIDEHQISRPFIEYGWLGNKALDYYFGQNRYRLLRDYTPGDIGTAIINVSSFYSPGFDYEEDCTDWQFVTPGVVACKIGIAP